MGDSVYFRGKIMVIRKRGYKWVLYNRKGTKKLGEFRTKKAALKRERQIIYFKHFKKR